MSFLQKMERKFGRFAIKNLTLYILLGYAVGFVVQNMIPQLYVYLVMDPGLVLKGQIWRLFTWVITPPQDMSVFVIFMFMFFYWIGSVLENTWGTFRYNLYIFSGIFFNTVGAMLTYGILKLIDPQLADFIPILITTYYINLTSFLAFALTFPDMQVMFMFIFPIKVKWLAIVDLVLIGMDFVSVGSQVSNVVNTMKQEVINNSQALAELDTFRNMFVWSSRAMMLIPLLNFIIFFLMTRNMRRLSPAEIKRKQHYKKEVKSATRMISKHKCAICGRTEADDEDLVFRFCSKCQGNYEYCQDHIFNHIHKS